MTKIIHVLTIIALANLSSATKTPIESKTDLLKSLRIEVSDLTKPNSNWIINKLNQKLKAGTKQNSDDFLVGLFSKVSKDGEIIDYEEVRECISAGDELHKITQSLISSSLSFASSPSNYEDFHNKIALTFVEFEESLIKQVRANCPDNEDIIKGIGYIQFLLETGDKVLSNKWNDMKQEVELFFNTFAAEISAKDYKHAFVLSLDKLFGH